jgi:hypothetical protein
MKLEALYIDQTSKKASKSTLKSIKKGEGMSTLNAIRGWIFLAM